MLGPPILGALTFRWPLFDENRILVQLLFCELMITNYLGALLFAFLLNGI